MAEQKETTVDDFKFDSANARKHGDKNKKSIADSMKQFGAGRSILVDADGVIRAGNGTAEAWKQSGGKIRVVESDGKELIVVKRTDLRGAEAMAYAIADNRAGELAEWDDEILGTQLDELKASGVDLELLGFDAKDLNELIPDVPEVADDVEPQGASAELQAKWKTEAGQLWHIEGKQKHRLLCGDSTKSDDTSRLIGGEKINVAITSPPYASQRKYDESSGFKPIHPDQFVEWFEPIAKNVKDNLASDGSWFINIKEHCEDGQRSLYVKDLTLAHAREWGWRFVDEFVWTKGGVPGKWSNRFKNQWEPIFHFCLSAKIKLNHLNVMHESDGVFDYSPDNRTSATGFIAGSSCGERKGMALPGNVLQIGPENTQTKNHSAPFPVALPTFFIKAFSDESDIIYEPFVGSGTTTLAAEQLNRKCYGIEISPSYCAVILQRMADAGCNCSLSKE
jgi:site-specific DNA-methyltransferase (adenine-specific)/site-specific DNA-methyltransferase (cytosine-N4-specific)